MGFAVAKEPPSEAVGAEDGEAELCNDIEDELEGDRVVKLVVAFEVEEPASCSNLYILFVSVTLAEARRGATEEHLEPMAAPA